MSPQPLQPPEHNDPAAPHKRHASPASPSVTDPDEARKRVRFAHDMDDFVLVSSDNQRFPFSSRLLLASSPRWQALLPSLSPLLPPADPPAPVTRPLPEVAHPESGETLAYLLHFLEPAPAHTRALSFPRDWELMRALERYSVRGFIVVVVSVRGGLKPGRMTHTGADLAHFVAPRSSGAELTRCTLRLASTRSRPHSSRQPSPSRSSSCSPPSSGTSPARRAGAAWRTRARRATSPRGRRGGWRRRGATRGGCSSSSRTSCT
ncbi:hypothetical protein DMC30DRAFT_186274 [Rhodotorula diobovata]|uniref:BTB domain-containing protein n=1 Tax=Rhodotorula diobovata TaxID=5288 RepID=A0A5C5FY61_9BASI|nr:hypothetical protein DMC30DRAFT_186274 [Rhodotorula diobovata]